MVVFPERNLQHPAGPGKMRLFLSLLFLSFVCNAKLAEHACSAEQNRAKPLDLKNKSIPSFATDMLSGAVARASAQLAVFPLDCLKTLRQTRGAPKGKF